jgi:hypothetical protein
VSFTLAALFKKTFKIRKYNIYETYCHKYKKKDLQRVDQ